MMMDAESSQSQCDPESGVLHLCLPLTVSGNSILGWTWSHSAHLMVYKRDAASAVWAAVTMALGGVPAVRGEHWADHATLGIVRCSRSCKPLDDDNVVGGCKYHRDALRSTGVIIDDNPSRLQMIYPVEDRPVGKWGVLHGPATHFFLTRVDEMPRHTDHARVPLAQGNEK